MSALMRGNGSIRAFGEIVCALSIGVALVGADPAGAATEPGALPGSFNVSSSGEATYSIPIRVPGGIGGLTPHLALSYNSSVRNDLLGYGWSLDGLSAVTVCPSSWSQDSVNSPASFSGQVSNNFCLDGERLVETTSNSGIYRLERDDFTLVTENTVGGLGPAPTAGPQYFVKQTPDGLTYTYGKTADSEILAVGPGIPVGTTMARAWALNSIADKYGNTIDFTYSQDQTNGDYWPISITYTDRNGTAGPYSIIFKYTSNSAGLMWTSYVSGAIQSETHRLREIDVNDNGASIFTYAITYDNTLTDATGNTGTERNRLRSVTMCAGAICYPATTVNWQSGTSGWDSGQPVAMNGHTIPSAYAQYVQMMDVNGDGRLDVVYPTATHWWVLIANGAGFNAPVDTGIATTDSAGFAGYTDAMAIDVMGSGQDELLVPITNSNNNLDWFFLTPRFSGGSFTGFSATDTNLRAIGAGGQAMVSDLNGDGLPDIVFSDGTNLQWYENLGGGSFAGAVTLETGKFSSGTNDPLAIFQKLSRLASLAPDFDGTGRGGFMTLTEKVFGNCTPDSCPPPQPPLIIWKVQEGGGYNSSPMTLGGASSTDGDAVVPTFVDFNGDGLADLLFADGTALDGSNWTWITYQSNGAGVVGTDTGIAWSSSVMLDSTPVDYSGSGRQSVLLAMDDSNGNCQSLGIVGYAAGAFHGATPIGMSNEAQCAMGYSNGSLRVADVNGDGLEDLVWVANGIVYYALHNGAYPDLVTSISNGFSKTYNIAYQPLSNGAAYTLGATSPPVVQFTGVNSETVNAPEARNYDGPLYVVNNYTVDDGVGGTVSIAESYAGAMMDQLGRGFLGFATITSTATHPHVLTNGIDGTLTEIATSNYKEFFPLTGTIASSTTTENGDEKSSTSTTWLSMATVGGAQFVYASVAKASKYILGGSKYLTSEIDTIPALSSGNFRVLKSSDVTTSTSPGTVTAEVVTTFDVDTTNWCLALGNTNTITNTDSANGQSQSRTSTNINDTTHCRVSSHTETVTDNGDNQTVETEYFYDPTYGNMNKTTLIATDAAGSASYTTQYAYDNTNTYVASITNPLNESSQFTWNTDLGLKSSDTDANDVSTSYTYDSFGLPESINAADGTSIVYTYCLSANGCSPSIGAYSITQTHYSAAQIAGSVVTNAYDNFGRSIRKSRHIIGGNLTNIDTKYDSLGRTYAVSNPYTGSPSAYTYAVFDLFDRSTAIYMPPGAGSSCTASIPSLLGGGVGCVVGTQYDLDGGFTTATTDRMGKVERATVNALGQLATKVDGYGTADMAETQFEYDPFGDLVQTTDAANNVTKLEYDLWGRKLSMTDPNMGIWNYTYDPRGLVITQTDPKGQITTNGYDSLGRMTSRQLQLTGGTIVGTDTWTYDGPNSVPTAPYIGKLYQLQGYDGYERQYQYDDAGRPDEVDVMINGVTYATTTSYDSFGRVGSVAYPATPLADADDPPVASAGANQAATVSQTLNLNGSGSYDPDNGPQALTYTWAQLDGPSSITTVNGATIPNPSFSTTVAGVYDFMLTVSDSELTSSATVTITVVPATPAGLSASSVNPGTGNFSLSWNTATGATSYAVEQSTNGGVNSMLPQTYTSATAPLTGYANGTYTFGVQGCAADNSGNNDICGQFSSTTNVTVLRTPGVPGMNAITPNPSTTGNYTVSWSTPSGTVTHYELYSSTDGSTYDNGTNIGNVSSWSPSSAEVNGSYWYKVAACNSSCSNPSTAKSVTVSRPVPAAPTLNANPTSISSGGSSTLTWSPNGSVTATSYALYGSLTTPVSGGSPIYSGSLKTYTVSPPFSRYYAVAGCNSSGCGALSSSVKVTVNLGGQMMVQPTGTITPTPPPSTTVSPPPATNSGGISALTPVAAGVDLHGIAEGATQRIAMAKAPAVDSVNARIASLRGRALRQMAGRIHKEKTQADAADRVVEIRNESLTLQSYAALSETADGRLISGDLNLAEIGAGKQATIRARHSGMVRAGSVVGVVKTGGTERHSVSYVYDQYENLVQVVDTAKPSLVYWQASSADAFGHVTSSILGNNVVTAKTYDLNTGMLEGVSSGLGQGPMAFRQNYAWDDDGNLASRHDLLTSQSETFTYDNLNRLRQVTNQNAPTLNLAVTYDAVGNIQTKSDVGTYYYNPTNTMQVDHIALSGGGTRSFSHDNTGGMLGDGNMVSDSSHNYVWDVRNRLTQVQNSSTGATENFSYSPDDARYLITTRSGSVTTTLTEVNGMFEVYFDGQNTYYKETIVTSDGPTVIRSVDENGVLTTRYLSADSLGSTSAITNEVGGIVAAYSYDAFGQERDPSTWQTYACGSAPPSSPTNTDKGYTGQQSMDVECLVHMNGRVYDPQVGRFISADPVIQDPTNTQTFNRYAYALNNPMSLVDPTGYDGDVTQIGKIEVTADPGGPGGDAGGSATPSETGDTPSRSAQYHSRLGAEEMTGSHIPISYDQSSNELYGDTGASCIGNCGSVMVSTFTMLSQIDDLSPYNISNSLASNDPGFNQQVAQTVANLGRVQVIGTRIKNPVIGLFVILELYAAWNQGNDVRLLARLIFAEEGKYNNRNAMIAAAWSVKNRVLTHYRGSSIQQVIYASDQYNAVNGKQWILAGDPSSLNPQDAAAYATALEVAVGVLDGSIPDNTNGAISFINGGVGNVSPSSTMLKAIGLSQLVGYQQIAPNMDLFGLPLPPISGLPPLPPPLEMIHN